MNIVRVGRSLLALAWTAAVGSAPAAAARVQRFELTANAPLLVHVGDTLELTLGEDIDTYHYNRWVPGDAEPGPVFIGDQSWFHGLEEHSNEWVTQARLLIDRGARTGHHADVGRRPGRAARRQES